MEDDELTVFSPRLASTPQKAGSAQTPRTIAICSHPKVKHLPPALFTTASVDNYCQRPPLTKQFVTTDPTENLENVSVPGSPWLRYTPCAGRGSGQSPTPLGRSDSQIHSRPSSTFAHPWAMQSDKDHPPEFKTLTSDYTVSDNARLKLPEGGKCSPIKSPPKVSTARRSLTPALGHCLPLYDAMAAYARSPVTDYSTSSLNSWSPENSSTAQKSSHSRKFMNPYPMPIYGNRIDKSVHKPLHHGTTYLPGTDEFSCSPTVKTDQFGHSPCQVPNELSPVSKEAYDYRSFRPLHCGDHLNTKTCGPKTSSALCDTTNLPTHTSTPPHTIISSPRSQVEKEVHQRKETSSNVPEVCTFKTKTTDGGRTPYSSPWYPTQWLSNESVDSGFDSLHRSPHNNNVSKSHDEFSSGECSSDNYTHKGACRPSVAYSSILLESAVGDDVPAAPEKPDGHEALLLPRGHRKLVAPMRSASPVDPQFRGVIVQMRTRLQPNDKVQLNIKAFFK